MSQANFEAENIIWKNEWIKIWNWKPYEKTYQTVHEGCKNVPKLSKSKQTNKQTQFKTSDEPERVKQNVMSFS